MPDIYRPTGGNNGLARWFRDNIVAIAVALGTMAGGTFLGAVTIGRTFEHMQNQLTQQESEIQSLRTGEIQDLRNDTRSIHHDVADVDRRINESNAAIASARQISRDEYFELKDRLNVLDALSKYAADRALASPLPPATTMPATTRRHVQ
jgi:hypothetical protein